MVLSDDISCMFNLQFHFDQSKVRSEIRLREGRAKPIDILSKHLNGSDDLDIELNEPYMVFKVWYIKISLYRKYNGYGHSRSNVSLNLKAM